MDRDINDGRKHRMVTRSMARKRTMELITPTERKRRKTGHSRAINPKESQNNSDSFILRLPPEILEKIIGMIRSYREIGKLRAVCSAFDNACSKNLQIGFKITERYVVSSVGKVLQNQFLSGERRWLSICMSTVRSAISGHISVMGLPACAGGLLDSYLRYLKGGNYVTTRECRIMTKKFLTNFYRIADTRLKMLGASKSLRRYVDIAGLLRLLKTCINGQQTIAHTVGNVAIYEFVLEGCWMGLQWSDRARNTINYPEEVGNLYNSLSSLVCASNAARAFRSVEEWPRRDRLAVLGYDAGPSTKKRPSLILRIQVEGSEELLQSLSEHVHAEGNPPDRVDLLMYRDPHEDEALTGVVHLECHEAVNWGCEKTYKFLIGKKHESAS